MGYQRVTRYCCDACGRGGRLTNSLTDDSLDGIKSKRIG